ncbi:MAG TPA: M20/M25/M40 family metallo-hydrolase [Candidatus Limnocylindrales bacterium]|nr:M20/M25/M40 family metallo-hydrolase [Candidatus Limnocylindrales bacterium]
MNVFELTRKLISIPSISGDEKAVAEFIAEYLSDVGFEVELQDAAEGRPNVYARRGEPDVVLSTHTDTVPPYVEFREDDEFIYGRGACDTKGIIAAMLKAGEALIDANVTDFGLLLVVGEEAGSPGAHAANTIPNRSRYLINGEPTESKLALGSKGALRAILRARGRAAHSAYPEMGESAIEKLLDVLNDLRRIELPRDQTLGATTMNIGMIKGGVAGNVIPPEAEAELMFRVVTTNDSLKRIIEDVVESRAELEYTFGCDPVFTERIDGFETTVVAFTTDIPQLGNWGKPLLFGPGSILDAHTPHERISKRELASAVDRYVKLTTRLKEKIANMT